MEGGEWGRDCAKRKKESDMDDSGDCWEEEVLRGLNGNEKLQ